MSVASSIAEGGYIGFTLDNVGIDRRIYTGSAINGQTNPTLNVSYNAGRVDVYLNGVKLVGNHPEMGGSTHDYTYTGAGQGSNIVLATGVALVAADVVECIGYVSNSSNTVTTYNPTPASGGGWNVFSSINHVASDLVNVYLNGVLLDDSDYTLDASANTLTIGGATLTASDVVMVQVIGALDNANFVPATGGTFTGTTYHTYVQARGTGDNTNLDVLSLENDDYEHSQTGQAVSQLFRLNRAGAMRTSASIKAGKDSNWADSANTDGFLAFSTAQNETVTERMRINSSGNVGLGTDDIDTKLHIAGTDGSSAGLMLENTNATANQRRFRIYSSAQKAYFDQPNDAYNSATDIMAFDLSNQNVGIATTSPQSKFHVNGEMRDSRGVMAGLYLQYGPVTITNGNNNGITQINGGSGIIRINSNHNMYIPFWTSGGGGVGYTIMWIDPDSGTNTSGSFSFSESGSNANTYTVSIGYGNGMFYIEATTMPSNYTVRIYRWF